MMGTSVVMVPAAAAVVTDAGAGEVRRVWQGDSSQSDSADTTGGRSRRHLDEIQDDRENEEDDDCLAEHYDPAM